MKTFVSSGGVQINYYENIAYNVAIVFIHGSSMSGKIWEKQLQSTELQKYHLLSVDLPGHGASPNSSNPTIDYTLPAYAALLAEFINYKQLKQYIMVGLSLGGNIIIEALPSLRNAAGLMLVSAAIVGNPTQLAEAFLPNPAVATIFSEQPEQNEVENLVRSYFAKETAKMPGFYVEDFHKTDTYCRVCLAQSIGAGTFSDEEEALQNTDIPVALVYGADDQLSNLSYIERLSFPKWKNSVLKLSGAGHMPQWEASDQFNQMLMNFIKDMSY